MLTPPVSQASPVSMTLSPQLGFLQLVRHASGVTLLFAPLSSHCSTPPLGPVVQPPALQTKPSPQVAGSHVDGHGSLLFTLPSSQPSPAAALNVPSPQSGSVQLASHVRLLPEVSHASPVSVTLSPQLGFAQLVRHASGVTLLFAPALSHCSAPPVGPRGAARSGAEEAVAARADEAGRRTRVIVEQVAVVAGLAGRGVERAVAADRQRAVRVAGRALTGRVACFARVDDAVAAARVRAVGAARIGRDVAVRAGVVALLGASGGTGRAAASAAHETVAAGRDEAGGRTRIRVGRDWRRRRSRRPSRSPCRRRKSRWCSRYRRSPTRRSRHTARGPRSRRCRTVGRSRSGRRRRGCRSRARWRPSR